MPALVLFDRRWLLASDDVPLPAAACALFHAVWCILLVIWFASVHGPRECSGAWQYDVAVGGLLAAFALSCGLEVGLVQHGLRGGPFEARRRRLVPRLIYLDFISHCFQVAFNSYSTYLLYNTRRPECEGGTLWDPFNVMLVLVWCTWGFIAALLLLLVLTYNLFPDYRDPKSWERRCTCLGALCCCCHRQDQLYTDDEGKPQRITARLGNIFATLFSHVDLTATDVLLAFSLAMTLQRIQRKRQKAAAAEASAGQGGMAHVIATEERQQQQQQPPPGFLERHSSPWPTSTIQLSTQNSPDRTASACSADELLSRGSAPDLESGLLSISQRRLLQAQLSSSGGATGANANVGGGAGHALAVSGDVSASELHRTSHFSLAHPQGSNLQVGAEKLEDEEEDEEAHLQHAHQHGEDLGPVDAETLRQAAWAMKFAFASYGYLLYIFEKPTSGCMQLLFGRNCGLLVGAAKGRRVRRKLDLHLIHNLNREATQQAAGLADSDLLDVRYEGQVRHVLPYFIAVDESSRSLVLAIRGSLSLDDVVRDLLFEPASLDEWVQPGRRWEDAPPDLHPASAETRYAAHAGILEAARATFLDIQQHGILHSALLAPGGRCHGYQLIVTGHSLGAGCAFLLALYLRHFCPYLRCFAFSPPGGLASTEISAASADWCTSVVCGKEWIPRLSVRTFQRMRDEMVFAVLRCKQPKWVVLAGLMGGKRWKEDDLFYAPHELPMEAREALRQYHDSVSRTNATRSFIQLADDFQPPGQCFQLRPTGVSSYSGGWCRRTKQRQYRAVYVDGHAIIDQGVLISGRMMADHMPDYCLATLRRLARSLRHSKSTTLVSDRAGERLTDQIMEHGYRGDGDGFSEAPSSSERHVRRHDSPSEHQQQRQPHRQQQLAATVPPGQQPSLLRRAAPGGGGGTTDLPM